MNVLLVRRWLHSDGLTPLVDEPAGILRQFPQPSAAQKRVVVLHLFDESRQQPDQAGLSWSFFLVPRGAADRIDFVQP